MNIIEHIVSQELIPYKKYIERLENRIQELDEKIKRKDALLDWYRKNVELKERRIDELNKFVETILADCNELQDALDKHDKKRK